MALLIITVYPCYDKVTMVTLRIIIFITLLINFRRDIIICAYGFKNSLNNKI